MNERHPTVEMCAKGAGRKRMRKVEEGANSSTTSALHAYGLTLEVTKSYKYMVRFLTVSDDNWVSLIDNLREAWSKWENFSRILGL